MASTFLHLLVIFLGVSHLICSNAVPVTRIGSLNHGHNFRVHQIAGNSHLVSEKNSYEKTITERMDVELHDYPGSGANNRHTPKPQFGRCADC